MSFDSMTESYDEVVEELAAEEQPEEAPAEQQEEPQPTPVATADQQVVLFKRGDAGTHIRKMQEYLNGLGFECPMNGRFCLATESALKAAQKELGLAVTGKLDSASCDALCG